MPGTLAPTSENYTTASGTQTLSTGDVVLYSGAHATGGDGTEGSLYQYAGPGGSLDLGSQGYDTDTANWTRLSTSDLSNLLFPNIGNLTDSNSRAYGGLVVYNDARGQVSAYIDNATITASAGDVSVTALEQAMIQATATSDVSSSGGSAFGSGDSIADNGQVVTNLVLASADAYISNATVTATAGSVLVSARNASGIDATIDSSSDAGGSTLDFTIAFNSIGWKAQNILFNAIDALLGDPAISSAFGGSQPADVQAYITDSTVNAGTDVKVTALDDTQVNATVSNAADTTASGLFGNSGKGLGAVLASNKVNGYAKAYIADQNATDGTGTSVTAGGGVTGGRRGQHRDLRQLQDRLLHHHHG